MRFSSQAENESMARWWPFDRIAAGMLAVLAAAGVLRSDEFDRSAAEFFETKVRPLLIARCYECHGPGVKEPRGGLRLGSRDAVLRGGDSGPAVTPGDPSKSLLIEAVNYESFEMPPRSKLPEGEIAILTEWVRRGAPWPAGDEVPVKLDAAPFPLEERRAGHWAWRPIGNHRPPPVRRADWPQTEIDRFILAKLEDQGLAPAAPADRRTLIRRASFDLTGLPPTPAEVREFLDDPAPTPQAFAKVVDRLLASPRFGERWARHWFDLVRYAETLGHEFDYPLPHAWRYRDYVVRAFNADIPYDQFVREHIAGDLLPNPRRHPTDGFNESIIGTGFWWLGEAKQAPVDARGEEAVLIENQIDVFSKTFLGLTVACARCHDHKFDAISTRDYYALSGFLQSSRRQEAWLDPHGRIADATDRLHALSNEADAVLAAAIPRSDGVFARLLLAAADAGHEHVASDDESLRRWITALESDEVKSPSHPLYVWFELAKAPPGEFVQKRQELARRLSEIAARAEISLAGTELFADFDGGTFDDWFVTGWAFGKAPAGPRQWDATSGRASPVQPGIAHSGMLSNGLRGALRSPTFTITHPQMLYRLAGEKARVRLIIDGYFMIEFHSLLFSDVSFDVETGGKFVWKRQAGDLGRYLGHRAWIEILDEGDGWIAVDEIRFAGADSDPQSPPCPLTLEWLQDETLDSLDALAARYGDLWNDALRRWHAGTIDPARHELIAWAVRHELVDLGEALVRLQSIAAEMRQVGKGVPDPIAVHAMTDGSGEDERVHIRGSHANLGEIVPRRMLAAISGPDQPPIPTGSGRLELAERLLAPSSPLPARVRVNRIWHHLFGRGLVESVDNFGVLGKEPTHPELLDFLAQRFIQEGWSIKRTIRRIVLSSAYQMASAPDPRAEKIDPKNLLVQRMPIRRLQGEAIRDAMLLISGRLDSRMFGPGIPVHLTLFMQGRGRPERSGPLDGDGRRSLYIEVRRNFPPPMMAAFDTPTPFTTIGRRNVSNVPAQALILMNDPFVIEQARLWAARALDEPQCSPEERIRRLYEAAFARLPSDGETTDALAFLRSQAADLGLLPDQWQEDLCVWADLCHVLMNVKEFVFVQ